MTNPLVSVVIPIYDRPLFLRTRAIPSLLRQTYPYWELIVVGDGPQDNAVRKVIEDFHDPRMRYVEIPRPDYSKLTPQELWYCAGAAARNYGLDLARGDIFAPLDDDDEFLETHLADSVHAISIDGYDFVYGKTILRDIETGEDFEAYLSWNDPANRILFEKQNITYHANVCYSSRFRDFRYPADGQVPDDYGLWLAIYHAGGRFTSLDNPQSIYYGDQLTSRLHTSIPSLPPLDRLREDVSFIFTSNKTLYNSPKRQQVDRLLADHLQNDISILVANGYIAFLMAFAALKLYQPHRNEVIISSYAHPIVLHAILQSGLKPVFCDIDPYSFCITSQTVLPLISQDTAVIIATHMYGNPCDMPALEQLAVAHNIMLFADASDALGSSIHGRSIGSFGAMTIFNLGDTDVLPGHEGAMICCQHPHLAHLLHSLGSNEQASSFSGILGFHLYMTAFSSALLLTQGPSLKNMLERRQQAATTYKTSLRDISGIRFQEMAAKDAIRTYAQMCIVLEHPNIARHVAQRLMAYRIESHLLGQPLHRQPAFAEYKQGSLYHTEQLADCILALPLYPSIREQVLTLVNDVCKETME